MKTMKFKCTLLSDIIISQKSGSESCNKTIDFIPGSNFLGIVAGGLYKEANSKTWDIFHSGKVRFGDAHPLVNNFRTLRTPFAMFFPKGLNIADECYIHHRIDNFTKLRTKQLKQARTGFYTFNNNEAEESVVEKTFTIKSAYDSECRSSKEGTMYGYESLSAGKVFGFEIEYSNDTEQYIDEIVKALKGRKRIGRSRTAQYGLIDISCEDYNDHTSKESNNSISVYADARLIFLDKNGIPKFQPTAKDLGLNGKIEWVNSQVRTFQYSPWNFKRQAFDVDRCGIEKGSIFVVCLNENLDKLESRYIGSYNNEGFGKVIYNPDFLGSKENSNGQSSYIFKGKEQIKKIECSNVTTPLINYLLRQKANVDTTNQIYKLSDEFVNKNHKLYIDDLFPSQWGTIRSIAGASKTKNELKEKIFEYIGHGIAAEKWEEKGRKETLQKFIDQLTDKNAQMVIINMASEMAKKCRRKSS